MSVVGGWVLAPLALALLCLGAGLAVERVARVRLPGPAVPGVGLAAVIVLAGMLTLVDATAEFAAPACALLALAGLVLGHRRLSTASVAVFAATFAILAWASLGSGQASVAGYIKLDDSAIWLGLIAHLMEHGRDIAGVPPSTFQLDLAEWLGQGYPVGTFLPVGVTARLTGQDLANVYQPVVCFYGALLALGAYGVVRELVRSRWLAAGAALVGAQGSLFVGYVWWGAVKEICVAALLPVFVLAARSPAGPPSLRALGVVALVAAAFMVSFGPGGILWAGAGCLAAAVLVFQRPIKRFVLASVGAFVVVVVGSIPLLWVFGESAKQATGGAPVRQEELGKLAAPLDILQGAGLWPAGDFRFPPDPRWSAVVLAVVGLVAAALAVAIALHRRRWSLPALAWVTLAGALPAIVLGAPWIDAKVLAVTSAVLLTCAAALVAMGLERRPLLTAPSAIVLVAAALWSTWLAARDVFIAPRDLLSELRDLGEKVDGRGPTLMLGYEGYATRYALYRGQIEGATDLRVSLVPSRFGEPFPNFSNAEVDDVDTAALHAFPLVVRRRTPVGSRPPAGYELFEVGKFFETWQNTGGAPVEHLTLGGGLAPAAQVECRRLRELAGRGSELAAAPLKNPVVADLATAELPPGWLRDGVVRPATEGRARLQVEVPEAGRWRVWVGGSTLSEIEVSVDGEPVGSELHQLDATVGWMRFDALELGAGRHVVELEASRSWWRPGRGSEDNQLPLGPVALTREQEPVVERLPAKQVDRLCDGRTYDWVEVWR